MLAPSDAPSALLDALQDVEEAAATRMVPAERAVLLLNVPRVPMERVRPAAWVVALLGQCTSLAHLDLDDKEIRKQGRPAIPI